MVFSKLPYDPIADFAPVAQVANFQFALSVNAGHPAKNMKDLVAWYKANPAKANYGSPAPGSLPHFFGVMIAKGAGIELVHVPYNGGGPMMNALMGEQVTAAIDTLGRAGRAASHRPRAHPRDLRDDARSPLLPEVPTFAEARPRGRRRDGVVRRLRAGEDTRGDGAPAQRGDQQGARQPRAARALHQARPRARRRHAADLAARMAQDTARWAPIVKASGFRAD